jgi:hypothetical protein
MNNVDFYSFVCVLIVRAISLERDGCGKGFLSDKTIHIGLLMIIIKHGKNFKNEYYNWRFRI